MPWKTIRPMDQKIAMIVDWQTGLYSKTDLSQKYAVSRKTVYKWIGRYEQIGVDGVKDQSRKPRRSPKQTPEHIVAMIVEEKLKNPHRGPKKIYHQLRKKHGDIAWPGPNTIESWLKKHGLVRPRRIRKHVPAYTQPFLEYDRPNAAWSADYKGQFHTGDEKLCYPLTISDNYSRYVLACRGLEGPRYEETREVFEGVFREHGLPEAIRTDNGTPFASCGIGGLSRLSLWWIQLGIVPERIEKGRPQQNGRHERMHRTLKAEALHPVAGTLKDQQVVFEQFREDYNNERPHEALGQRCPREYYRRSRRLYVENPRIPDYDFGFMVRKVRSSGDFRFKSGTFYIAELLARQHVGIKEIHDGVWGVYYSFMLLGTIDWERNKVRSV